MTFHKKIEIAETKMPVRILFLLCLTLILSTCFKLWLVGAQHLTAVGGAVHDDRLFINIAKALLSGKWLGPFNNTVLAKGPFYPIWIAMVSASGMPLLLAQHLLYAVVCALFVAAVKPLLKGALEIILVFLVLLFNPMSYMNGVMTQVTREGIYPALTILVFACASGLLVRVKGPVSTVARWAAGLGLSISAFWLTREEGLWIVPGIIFIIGAAVVSVVKAGPRDWKRISLLFVPVLIMLLVLSSVAILNSIRYGVAAVTEMKSPEFLAAYGALLRVKHKDWKLTVPVPEDVRERLYAVSPAFAELKPSLEGEPGKRWGSMLREIREACKRDPAMARKFDMYLKMDASGIWKKAFYNDDGDILGGGFLWAFRDAVASVGHYTSGKASREYYRRLAAEVNTACAEGRLDCGPEKASLMPPWHHEYDYPFLKTLGFGAFSLAMFEGFDVGPEYSNGDPEALKLFRDLTHERLAPSEFVVRGWAVSPGGNISILLKSSVGEQVGQPVKLLPSPDVYSHFLSMGRDFPGAQGARFDISGPIVSEFLACKTACFMHIEKDGKLLLKIPLDGTVLSMDTPDLYLYFDFLGLKDGLSKLDKIKIKTLGLIADIYRFLVPIFVVLALVVYIIDVRGVFRGGPMGSPWIIASFALIAVICRLIVLSLINVTSFPGILPNYLSPAYPLIVIFMTMVLIPKLHKILFWNKQA